MSKETVVIDAATQKNIDSWLTGDYDAPTKEEILRLQREDPEELLNAFYTTLSFGTGGLRGIVGVGTNRMNGYNVRATTQGLANYLLSQPTRSSARHAVVIGYDCRCQSLEFAQEAARVLAANGIEVFLYKELRPVALVSFGVLYKKATAGIMITASHNPPKYNGYKVYWDYGGQVLPPHDKGIIDQVRQITTNTQVKQVPLTHPLIHLVDEEIDLAYMQAIRPWQIYTEDNHKKGSQLSVVYTSLHGTGITMIPRTLREWGFVNLHIVKEQEKPDGHFPTVASPNPEYHETLALGVAQLQAVQGDLLLATDPDTDRLGVVVLHQGKPFFFNGNEIACLLLEHVCRALKATGRMPAHPTFVKTIVTTELFRTIAEHHGGSCLDVLTGFKYIGERIALWEKEQPHQHDYIFGGEESYGYLLGTHARDKDAIISAASLCEAALQLKLQNRSLVDFLYEMYEQYGIVREQLTELAFSGKEGAEQMQQMMQKLRTHPPTHIGTQAVTVIEDYLTQQAYDYVNKKEKPLSLPISNVLRIWLSDQTTLIVRPSGTEPKIKLYCAVRDKSRPKERKVLETSLAACDQRLVDLLQAFKMLL